MSRTSRRGRRAVVVVACSVALIGTSAGTWAILSLDSEASTGDERTVPRHVTAPVTRSDLAESKVFAGKLDYGTPVAVRGAEHGTLTWLPRPGDVIERDQPLYALDERPVRAMHGTVPLWRTLEVGRQGQDVAQLNANLAALGYDVAQDDVFGPRTRQAVRHWQRDRGLAVTGAITAADIAFVDGDVRVAAVVGQLGSPPSDDVLQVTGTTRVVTTTAPQGGADLLAVGTEVKVAINGGGDPVPGRVTDVTPRTDPDGGETVQVTIDIEPGERTLPTAATAQVEATGQTASDVLSVPVAALIAGTAAGEYVVEVAQGDGTLTRVPVEVGLVADGRVAVTGELAEGDQVVVPA